MGSSETGNKIRELRLQKGWTQKKLSEESGINETQIRRYELGIKNSNPKTETLRRIAEALGVGLDAFIDLKLDGSWKMDGSQKLDGGNDLVRTTRESNTLLEGLPRTHQEAVSWKESVLLEQYHKLNEDGQTAAVEAVENLTYNPKYKK